MASKKQGYTVAVTGPGHDFNREIDEPLAIQILNLVTTGSLTAGPTGGNLTNGSGTGGFAGPTSGGDTNFLNLNPKQFIAQKKPKTQYERIACLAYYLTNARNTPQFGTEEITTLNTEAAQATIKNAPVIVRDTTVKYRYLSAATDRNKQITALGEAVVEALPNRDAVTSAIAEHRQPTKRKRPAKKKKK
jgi:hypothetical protein